MTIEKTKQDIENTEIIDIKKGQQTTDIQQELTEEATNEVQQLIISDPTEHN
jgi:hypothetical protein